MLVLTPMMALSSSSYRKIYLRVQEMRRPSCPREHAIADDAALDFTGTFEDCSQPCVAPIAFDSPFCGVAVAAVELHGFIGDTHGHFGGEQLHLRGLTFRRLAMIQQMRDLLPEGSSLGDLGGQRKPQRLKLTDRLAELLALLKICPRVLKGDASDADSDAGRRG
jgi:hypothetical protein